MKRWQSKVMLHYQIDGIDQLAQYSAGDDCEIRWIILPDDFHSVYQFFREKNPDKPFDEKEMLKSYQACHENGEIYCALFSNDRILAMAAVEKYSERKWETGCVRVSRFERNKGYAKQICYFVTKYTLDNGRISTCCTEDDNIPMQKVIQALGFTRCES